ncbi:MAG TPA: helix-turn-helix transcriptional regulator [Bacteroidales bacterium]|nr:helix-turn-helix transcriptional regulator [Bacteroidales bacterium]HPT22651.1 helix-turn-helix transcriptional regulator [Bacteroidales bacterium]
MKERIMQFLKAENKSSAQLAEEIGVQPSGISHILSGRNKPSLDFVTRMLEKYKFLSTEWLLFGKGNMYREEGTQKLFDDALSIAENVNNEIDKKDVEEIKKTSAVTDAYINKSDEEKPQVEKIVWFFRDGSFREYTPGR